MRHSKFKALARRSEERCSRDQASYIRRLRLFASLGALYYAIATAALPIAAAFCVWSAWYAQKPMLLIYAVFFLSLFAFAGFKGFFAKSCPPQGLEIHRKDFPALFKEIDAVAGRLSAPLPSHVLLDCGMNAMAAHVPGRWLFGRGELYLVLGLPLMASGGRDELRATIGHELGHFSHLSPGYMRSLRRVEESWRAVKVRVDSSGDLTRYIVLGIFANWFLPRLEARLSALSRIQEFEADAKSVVVAGRAAAGRSLALVSCEGRRVMLELVRPFWDGARKSKELPKEGPLPGMLAALRSSPPSKEALKAFVEASAGRRALGGDSHPSLAERLAKMGFDSDSLGAFDPPDAAALFLGDSEKALVASLDAAWRADSAQLWSGIHEEALRAKRTLSEMLRLDFSKGLTLDMELRRAQLLELAEGPEAARAPLEDILNKEPGCAKAKLQLGRVRAVLGDRAGAAMMLEAMAADPSLLNQGALFLCEYYRAERMDAEYDHVAALWESSLSQTRKEAPELKLPKSFEGHRLPGQALDSLMKALKENGNVAKAYLVLAKAEASGGSAPHVLVVARKFSLLAFRGENDEGLSKELASKLPPDLGIRVVPFDKCPVLAGWRIRRVKGSMIYKE